MKPERWEQVAQLHRAALEREESQRADFLREACSGDDELRRDVESLLAYEREGGGFMESPMLQAAARVLARETARSRAGRQGGSTDAGQDPLPLPAGTRFGRYEVIGLLGAGGMGEVYRATDPQLGREVAIKVLPQEMAADPQALARFKREARIVAALSHPNLLRVYDFGEYGGLQVYRDRAVGRRNAARAS